MAWIGIPITGTLDYPTYTELGGGVGESDFPRYLALANEVVRQVTMDRDLSAHSEQVAVALTHTINALAEYGEFTSERLGSYTYTRPNRTRADVDNAARNALSGTGLTYRGI